MRLKTIGFAIYQDPGLFANVKEPYLLVEDCDLGCSAKLYSEDKSITKPKLKELWDKHLNCPSRFQPEPSKPMSEVMSEHQLKMLTDPSVSTEQTGKENRGVQND